MDPLASRRPARASTYRAQSDRQRLLAQRSRPRRPRHGRVGRDGVVVRTVCSRRRLPLFCSDGHTGAVLIHIGSSACLPVSQEKGTLEATGRADSRRAKLVQGWWLLATEHQPGGAVGPCNWRSNAAPLLQANQTARPGAAEHTQRHLQWLRRRDRGSQRAGAHRRP